MSFATKGYVNNKVGAVDKKYSELITSGTHYIGTWNAGTNTPRITQGSGNNGDWYNISDAGTWEGINFLVGDKIQYSSNKGKWERIATGVEKDDTAMVIEFIDENTQHLPTQRPSGKPLLIGDWVEVKSTAVLNPPLVIDGITFDSYSDQAVWNSEEWQEQSYSAGKTNEVKVSNSQEESLTGNAGYQNEVNSLVANIIGKNKTLSVENKNNIIDAINYAYEELKKAGYTFEITESDSSGLRSIVFSVKNKDGSSLLNKTLNDFVLKARSIAGHDLSKDITAQEVQDAIKSITATLTNKTINADNNTITDLELDNFKDGVVKTQANTQTGGSDNSILTEKGTIDLHKTAGHLVDLSIDGKVLTIKLKDKSGTVIDTKTTDIEFVKSMSWDNTTPKLTLTKSDNTTVDIELTKAVITDKTQTLTNKTINVDENTVSNIEVDNFKSTAIAKSSDNVRNFNSASDSELTTEKFIQKVLQNIFTPQNDTDAVNKLYVDTLLEELTGKVMKFKGFINATAPTGTIADGSFWIESSTLPSSFPVNIRTYSNGQWSSDTTEYTPATMELWSNLNDSKGYYWFGNEWNLIDENVVTDNVTITKNQNGELTFKTKTSADAGKAWVVDANGNFTLKHVLSETDNATIQENDSSQIEVKDGGITKAKLNSDTVDNSTIELDSTNGIQVKDSGITKEKLNGDVVDNTTLAKTSTGELEVKNTGITNDKLANDVKVGSLDSLTTTEKTSLVSAINELNTNKVNKETGKGLIPDTDLVQITTNKNNITLLNDNKADKSTTYTKTEVDTELNKKVDKKTTAGLNVYSHTGDTQGEMAVKTAMSTTALDTNLLTEKGTKDYVDNKIRYVHTVVRYNNDNFDYTMGWFKIINNKATMTIDDFKQWFTDNNYNSAAKSWYWCGGCCGTTGVRNSADTGTSYIGRVTSGVFYVPAEDSFYFKYDYNGTVTILYSRIKITSEQI